MCFIAQRNICVRIPPEQNLVSSVTYYYCCLAHFFSFATYEFRYVRLRECSLGYEGSMLLEVITTVINKLIAKRSD